MLSSIFDPHADQQVFQSWMTHKAPDRCYAIMFTARSGSSWLTSVLTNTRKMGTPGEWFNPSLMPSSSRSKGARDLDEFVSAISRHEIHGGVFGFEITYHQLIAVFESVDGFHAFFPDLQYFWLVRRDIVAQAASLLKMEQTHVSHATHHSPDEILRADIGFTYDADRIKQWINHNLAAEHGTEEIFGRLGVQPSRISYEGLTDIGEQATADYFARCLGIQIPGMIDFTNLHKKVGTDKNSEFAARFRDENVGYMEDIDAQRNSRLALHIP